MQAVGRGLRGGCCSNGDSTSGLVHSRSNRPGDGHRPDPAWPMNLRRARQRGETFGSCPGACHAACLRVRCPARRGVGRRLSEPGRGARTTAQHRSPESPSIGMTTRCRFRHDSLATLRPTSSGQPSGQPPGSPRGLPPSRSSSYRDGAGAAALPGSNAWIRRALRCGRPGLAAVVTSGGQGRELIRWPHRVLGR
jgi:hypothetical protein